MDPNEVKVVAEISDLQIHNGHYYIIVVASIVSFAVTQIIKPFIKSTCDDKASAITRAFAVITGAIIGWTLSYDIIDMWLGAAAGGVNAFIVKLLKARAQSSFGVSKPESKSDS